MANPTDSRFPEDQVQRALLVTLEEKDIEEDRPRCELCRDFISSGKAYRGEPRRVYFHKSCAELRMPGQLKHFYHKHTICQKYSKPDDGDKCDACSEDNLQSPYYCCYSCDFKLDISCAVMPEALNSQGKKYYCHEKHGHPLICVDANNDDECEEIRCVACLNRCDGEAYVCRRFRSCKFFLHKSCFDLPQSIKHHPYHPGRSHRSLLTYERPPKTRCSVCCNVCEGFFYHCDCGGFNVDAKCPVKLSTISYPVHHHKLMFIEHIGCNDHLDNHLKKKRCRACGKDCRSSSSLFRCVECDYNLHLECGPLPCTIFDKNKHIHSLKLTDSPVDEDIEQRLDTDVFYCDECEKERDPRLPVYYCSEGCPYIAEIKCVISEVKLSLAGDYGEVELMSLLSRMGGRVIGKHCIVIPTGQKEAWLCRGNGTHDEDVQECVLEPLTCNEIINSFTDEDINHYRRVSEAARQWALNDTNEQSMEYATLFSDKTRALIKSLYSCKSDISENYQSKIFKVDEDDHFVLSDFKFIIEFLSQKYNDISVKQTLKDSMVKKYFLFILCWIISSMCTTRAVDISMGLLSCWWESLKMVHFAGFKTQFIADRLNKVVAAYYGLQAKSVANENIEEMDREITELSQDIEKLEATLSVKRERLKLLKDRRKFKESKETLDSVLVAECLREASKLKWKVAGVGLLA